MLFEHTNVSEFPWLKIGNSLNNGKNGKIFIPCINFCNEDIQITVGTTLGSLHHINYEEGPDTLPPTNNQNKMDEVTFNLDHLSKEHKDKMQSLLSKNLDVFSKGSHDLGRTWMLEHEINVQQNDPIR